MPEKWRSQEEQEIKTLKLHQKYYYLQYLKTALWVAVSPISHYLNNVYSFILQVLELK
jgi:hypothetical protein